MSTADTPPEDTATSEVVPALAPIDMLLGEGSDAEQRELRHQLQQDPAAMFAMADAVALVEQCRSLRIEPSLRYAGKLADVVHRASHRAGRQPRRWREPLLGWLAATVTFAVLWHLDPLARTAGSDTPAVTAGGASHPHSPLQAPAASPSDWESTIDRMRQRLAMESTPHLREALEQGLAGPADPLAHWLDPRNALVHLQLEHERRGDAAVRQAALVDQGSLAAIDDRAQVLADAVAGRLPGELRTATVADVATAVRALLAAGPGDLVRQTARQQGTDWLVKCVPSLRGSDLVLALSALAEASAVGGQLHDVVSAEGRRFLDQVLQPDGETWSRWLPELLGPNVSAAVLAEGNRLLLRLPGFGCDSARCHLVRQLVLGQLRQRRALGDSGPEVLAAMVYGSGDLLTASERTELESQARRWQAVHLVPDFGTVRQLLWSVAPGEIGFARLQGEMRLLSVGASPTELQPLAAFCMCLATNYAAFPAPGKAAGKPRSG